MAIQEIKCPHCQNAISVQSEWLGMNLQCPSCQNNFIYTEEQPAAAPEIAPVVTPATGVDPAATPDTDAAAEKPRKANMFTALARYANFTGRANRREYWLFVLFQILLFSALYIASLMSFVYLKTTVIAMVCLIIGGIAALIFFIPNLAVLIRRFHDRGHSWAWFFIYFTPCIGPLWFLISLCCGSVADNKWGKNPNAGKRGEAWPCVLTLFMSIILGGVVIALTILCVGTLIIQALKGTFLEKFIPFC